MRSGETRSFSEVNRLSDLREIVQATADWPADASVTLKESKSYTPTDYDVQSVTVTR